MSATLALDHDTVITPSSSTLDSTIVTTADALKALVPEWDALIARSRCRHPFLSAAWMATWFAHLGQSRGLFVVTVRDGARLVAVAPLSIEASPIGGVAVRRLCFLADREVGSDHLGLLIEPAHAAPAIALIGAAIIRERDRWDYIALSDTDPESPHLERLAGVLAPAIAAVRVAQASPCPYAPLPSTFDEYFAALGSNLRSKLRRLGRRFAEKGVVEWTEHTSGPELTAAYDALIALHGRRFDDRGDESSFLAPRAQEFHRAVLPALAANNWVRIFSLKLDGKTVAALMGYMTADKFLFYQAGMDPDLSEMRPGQLLMSHTIDRAVQLGCVEYDFLRGSEAYKQMWAKEVRHTLTFTMYGHGWRARIAQAAHWIRLQARNQKRRFAKAAPPPAPPADNS